MYGDLERDYEKMALVDFARFYGRPKCEHCGGTTEVIPGNPNSYTKWCCDQAREDVEVEADKKAISRLKARGYQVIKAKLRRCPACGSPNIIMFTGDEDLCTDCRHTFFPGD